MEPSTPFNADSPSYGLPFDAEYARQPRKKGDSLFEIDPSVPALLDQAWPAGPGPGAIGQTVGCKTLHAAGEGTAISQETLDNAVQANLAAKRKFRLTSRVENADGI